MKAWITRETLGETYTTKGGHKVRRRVRQTIEDPDRMTEREFTKQKLGPGASFLVEWQATIGGKLKRFSRKMRQGGWSGFRAARLERTTVQANLDSGEFVRQEEAKLQPAEQPPAPPASLREVVKLYEETWLPNVRTDSTRKDILRTLTRFVQLVGGDVPIANVGKLQIAQFTNARQTGEKAVSVISVNKDLRYLRQFFRTIYDWDLIPKPVKVSELSAPEPNRPVMTLEQFERLIGATSAATMPFFVRGANGRAADNYPRWLWWRAALAVYWESGVRRVELLGIKWADVDLKGRRCLLESLSTKTKQKRMACLGELSVALLTQLRGMGLDSSEYVFPWPHGVDAMTKQFNRILKAAGIAKVKHFAFHAARHAVGENVGRISIDAAQARLGHKNRTVTTRYYAKAAVQELAASVPMPIPESLRGAGSVGAEPQLRCSHDVEGDKLASGGSESNPAKSHLSTLQH